MLGHVFLNRYFKYYTSNFILLTSENLGNAEMKKVKCIHNLITRETVSMGKPHHIQLETSPHLEPRISSGENTTPSLPPLSHQCQSHLVLEWITGSCMTIAKTLKLDLSCHFCTRHCHLTFVRKTPHDWRSLIEGLPHTMYSAYCFNTPHVQAPSRVQCWGIVNSWFILMTIYLLQEVRGSMGGEGVTG